MKNRPNAIDKKLSEQAIRMEENVLEVIQAMLQHPSIYKDYNRAKVYEDIRDKWRRGGRLDVAIQDKSIDQTMASEIIATGTTLTSNLRACDPKMLRELVVAGGDPMQLAVLLETKIERFQRTACGNGHVPFADLGGALQRECSRCHKWCFKHDERFWGSSSICALCYPEFLEEEERNKEERKNKWPLFILIVLFLLWYFWGE